MARKEEKSFWDKIKWIAEVIAAIGVIAGIGYGVGKWQSYIEYKTILMEKEQEYNIQITNLKLDYNNRILEMQNKLQIVEMSKNVKYGTK